MSTKPRARNRSAERTPVVLRVRTPEAPAREDVATSVVAALWARYRSEAAPPCPRCPRPKEEGLGVAAHPLQAVYRLQCATCGWRSSWFEAAGEEILELHALP
jgi:hypothetical protein